MRCVWGGLCRRVERGRRGWRVERRTRRVEGEHLMWGFGRRAPSAKRGWGRGDNRFDGQIDVQSTTQECRIDSGEQVSSHIFLD